MSNSATEPSFDEVAKFVRVFTGFGSSKCITPQTRLEADLGVTGDDGSDLLLEAEKCFNSRLIGSDGCITTFGLSPNECLFHDEVGIGSLLGFFFANRKHIVRDLTVGELHGAICRHRFAPVGAA